MKARRALEVLNNPTKKEHWDLQNKAYETLLDLVERNEPKRVKNENNEYKCPTCNSYEIEIVEQGFYQELNLCQECGQRLDWSRDND